MKDRGRGGGARLASLLLAAALAALAPGAVAAASLAGPTMGTRYLVRLPGTLDEARRAGLQRRVEALLAGIEQRLSSYRPDSEVSRFNAARTRAPVPVSADFLEVARVAEEVSRWSAGAFDITVAPLVALWGFGPWGPPRAVPAAAAIEAARARVDYRLLEIDPRAATLRKRRPDLAVDLGGIAKGYAVDALAALLAAEGWRDHLVEIGGEVRAAGRAGGGRRWRVAIERPDPAQAAAHVLALRDEAVASSGDYRDYFVSAGVRYSHTIDPRSGRPIAHGLAAVSVIQADATRADALATALMVLGPEAGLAAARAARIPALLVARTCSAGRCRLSERMTAPFRERLLD